MKKSTADLCDENSDKVNIAEASGFRDFGGRKNFHGEIHTIKCFENNPFVKAALEKNGHGKVLVIDGGASMKCALLGDMLGKTAVKNKWNGIIVNGCVRDSKELLNLNIGIKALGTNPRKSLKKNEGEENVIVNFAKIDFIPGGFIYCDPDGIIVSREQLI